VKKFHSYGDMPPWGKGPVQGKIYSGPQYINNNFPLIDKMKSCTVQRIQAGSEGYVKDQAVREATARSEGSGDDEEEEQEDDEWKDDFEEEEDDEVEQDGDEPPQDIAEEQRHRELDAAIGLKGSLGHHHRHVKIGRHEIPLSPLTGAVAFGSVALVTYGLVKALRPQRKLAPKTN